MWLILLGGTILGILLSAIFFMAGFYCFKTQKAIQLIEKILPQEKATVLGAKTEEQIEMEANFERAQADRQPGQEIKLDDIK